MTSLGEMIARLGTISVRMGEMQLKGVTPQIFARDPVGPHGPVRTNHAAFVFGHLALYPANICAMTGLAMENDLAACAKPAGYEELFAAGKECLDDPTGKIYPSMDHITRAFFAAHEPILRALPGVAGEVLERQNPREQSRDRFPTVGHLVTFYLTSHIMMHMGQVSAWRRCHGLGSVM